MRATRRLGVAVLAVSCIVAAHSERARSEPLTSAQPADGDALQKLDGPLRQLLASGNLSAPAGSSTTPTADFGVTLGNLIGVTIRTASVSETLDALFALGRLAGNVRGDVIETYLAIPDALALLPRSEILRMEAIVPPKAQVTSQGQSVHNASSWIAGGLNGHGVKVGVIDVGFLGIQALINREIPGPVTARCYTLLSIYTPLLLMCDAGSNHGTAVAESLMDIAPGAQLYIAQPTSRLDFANTVDWMVSEGVKVINYSVSSTWDGPGDGTSPYSDSPLRVVDSAVARGTTFVVSAGNSGLASWLGAWRDTDGDNIHEFSTTTASELNSVSLGGGERIEVQMRWQDSWTAAATDLDVALVDSGGNVIARSASRQTGRVGDAPSEYFSTTAPVGGRYYLKVTRVSGPVPAWLQVQGFNFVPLQYATPGSIGSPAESATPGVIAVGAAAWNTPTIIEPFSSTGPTPNGRVKPDIVGADQGTTVTYGSFGGTSQAAPHIAGLAALVKAAFPTFTPQQVAGYLTTYALPRDGGRPNNTWGWGFAKLPNLCSSTVTPASPAVDQAGGPLQFAVTTVGSCAWSSSAQSSWLSITSGASGTGNGTVRVTVAPNAGAARVGTLVIASTGITISQTGPLVATTFPRNLVASQSGNIVTLTWQAPDSPTAPSGYIFEVGTQPGSADLATMQIGSTLYFSFEASPGLYYARIRASYGGTPSPPSNEVNFRIGAAPTNPLPTPTPTPNPTGPPSAPVNFTANASGRNVSLSWSPPASGTAGLTGFLIEAGSGPGLANLAVVNVAALTMSAAGVGPGTYYLRVRAVSGSGVGPVSNEAVMVVSDSPSPGNPTGLVSSVVGSTVTLQWQPPSSGGVPTGYAIVAGSAPGLSNVAVVPIGLTTGVTATGVPRGTYFIRIVATNSGGAGAPSNEAVVVVP